MRIKSLLWKVGVPLLIVVACSPAVTTPTVAPNAALSTQPATMGPIATATDLPATDVPATIAPATEVPTAIPTTEVASTEVAAAQDIPGRPDAPASPDAYRSDPESLVGATGRPQLVEFFTYW